MTSAQTAILRKSTQATCMLRLDPVEEVMFFVRRFLQNPETIYTLLNLIERLIDHEAHFSQAEKEWVETYLQLALRQTRQGTQLYDRRGLALDTPELLHIRDQILHLTEKQALALVQAPRQHSQNKAFKQVLTKNSYDQLSQEETQLLREGYLKVRQGQIFTLSGRLIASPSWTQRWIWKLIS
ncbi:hypothetical protein COW36_19965 [bacterium (Candidatus Blackallbacteria) CG17_big_fil_post_rev_8_21_14_2_50_48_46]|uniref:Uncharacterized protein n=1 Tax=bacterium (Candidatus Blackallbacteria) CG17_big_fil_post_rev_8_21_14_2_50_48_46 TaxID=2014261 RepID=A0A2M7FZT8_9BACT|nr:MAG: hypothetical protein COW64_15330 [bacterium (Candidatus Blackallbacteria) CG18_big_fil_WC_8_21_14_2_50_49_26]PIW14925.1 MAG: hypothetical protein COW36_19965 [bacterium (Candidatus Blackallbacteria) CG17_big_fil_post_rev_8_21_14_2_50_48_46]PIW44287.1 MAG: hypothetical protein COW20_24395 [bacterium (Candidatus Blackallbacteria) CG13_big_fil_rev_8_21_14_2_50_49_14]